MTERLCFGILVMVHKILALEYKVSQWLSKWPNIYSFIKFWMHWDNVYAHADLLVNRFTNLKARNSDFDLSEAEFVYILGKMLTLAEAIRTWSLRPSPLGSRFAVPAQWADSISSTFIVLLFFAVPVCCLCVLYFMGQCGTLDNRRDRFILGLITLVATLTSGLLRVAFSALTTKILGQGFCRGTWPFTLEGTQDCLGL